MSYCMLITYCILLIIDYYCTRICAFTLCFAVVVDSVNELVRCVKCPDG